MKKIKKTFLYLLGAFLAFAFNRINVLAQGMPQLEYGVMPSERSMPAIVYGVEQQPLLTTLDKILSVIFSPIFIAIIAVLAITVGTIILIKKKKNAKKNS